VASDDIPQQDDERLITPVAVPFTLPVIQTESGAEILLEEPSIRKRTLKMFLVTMGGISLATVALIALLELPYYKQAVADVGSLALGWWMIWRAVGREYMEIRRPRALGRDKEVFWVGRAGSPDPIATSKDMDCVVHPLKLRTLVGPDWSGWAVSAIVGKESMILAAAKTEEAVRERAHTLPTWVTRLPLREGAVMVGQGFVRL
jgi:hypothetical protein